MASIRRHKFVSPYPSPGIAAASTSNLGFTKGEEKKNIKPQLTEVKPSVKQEASSIGIKQEASIDTKPTGEEKPDISQLQAGETRAMPTLVKQEAGMFISFLLGVGKTQIDSGVSNHADSLSVKQEALDANIKEGGPC